MAADRRQQLLRAATVRVSIDHPHLVPARLTRDRDGHRVRLVLQLSSAPRLDQLLASRQLEARTAVQIVCGVASATDALNRRDLVAGSIAPDRILLEPKQGAVLADPGLPADLANGSAPEADEGAEYRSPEERRGLPVDARSNVYSLGALLSTLLTGAPPGRQRNGGMPAALDGVVTRAMNADPQRRYAGAREFALAAASAYAADASPAPAQRKAAAAHPAAPKAAKSAGQETAKPVAPEAAHPARPKVAKPPGQEAAKPVAPEAAHPAKHRAAKPPKQKAAKPSRAAKPARPAKPAASRGHRGRAEAEPRPRRNGGAVVSPDRLRQTLRDAAGLGAGAAPAVLRKAHGLARNPRLVMVCAWAICALAGVAIAQASGGESDAPRLSEAALSLRLAPGWVGTSPAGDTARVLSDPLAAAPTGASGTGMVAGRVRDADAVERFLGLEGGSRLIAARLGPIEAWRYARLRPGRNLVAKAYLAPTTGSPVLVLCYARKQDAAARISECERMASTLDLTGARWAGLSTIERRRETIERAMAPLRRGRLAARERLAKTELAPAQAKAARELERIYEHAADDLARGTSAPEALVRSLRATAGAYGDLAQAAAHRNREAYRVAGRAVLEDEAAVRRVAALSATA